MQCPLAPSSEVIVRGNGTIAGIFLNLCEDLARSPQVNPSFVLLFRNFLEECRLPKIAGFLVLCFPLMQEQAVSKWAHYSNPY